MKVSPVTQGVLGGVAVVLGGRLFEYAEQSGSHATAFACGGLLVAVAFMAVKMRNLLKRLDALEGAARVP